MAVTTIFMINLTLLDSWHRYSNIWFVFWPSDYNWTKMWELTILLVAVAILIYCSLSHITFLIRPVSFTIFRLLCSTYCIVQRDILYYKYNYKFLTYNRMTKPPKLILSVYYNFILITIINEEPNATTGWAHS